MRLQFSKSSRFFALVAFMTISMLTLGATVVSAQADPNMAPDLPLAEVEGAPTNWKALPDYTAVVATERANTAIVLINPNTKEPNTSLYNGYDRMLSYMQADLAAGVPVEEIAIKNFNKVVQETPGDPTLVNMQSAAFVALYDALVVMLHQ